MSPFDFLHWVILCCACVLSGCFRIFRSISGLYSLDADSYLPLIVKTKSLQTLPNVLGVYVYTSLLTHIHLQLKITALLSNEN